MFHMMYTSTSSSLCRVDSRQLAIIAATSQWLFFVRLFADLTGRLLPRVKRLALGSQGAVLALGLLMLALTPLFYLYIALAPPWLISDTLACGRAWGAGATSLPEHLPCINDAML